MFVMLSLLFVAAACVVALLINDRPARRCAIALAGVHLIANLAGWMTTDWFQLFTLNLAAMFFTFWKPAGLFQRIMAGLFLAGAAEHLAFYFSSQSHHAETVAWQIGTGIALVEASALLIYSGGRLVGRTRLGNALRRRRLVPEKVEAVEP
jgi:hypothetical protein